MTAPPGLIIAQGRPAGLLVPPRERLAFRTRIKRSRKVLVAANVEALARFFLVSPTGFEGW
jgi:hypothetical protein